MQNLNKGLGKRALSDIVSNVMLVLIGIALVSLISGAIIYFVKGVNLSPKFSCNDANIAGALVIENACFNSSSGEIKVSVKRSFEEFEIDNLYFVLSNKESSSSWVCCESCGGCKVLGVGEKKSYYFDVGKEGRFENVGVRVDECAFGNREIRDC